MAREYLQPVDPREVSKLKNSVFIIGPPHLSRLVFIDLRLSEESSPFVAGFQTADVLPHMHKALKRAAFQNDPELPGMMAQAFYDVLKYVDSERRVELNGTSPARMIRYYGSAEELRMMPMWRVLSAAVAATIGTEVLDCEVDKLIEEENRDMDRNFILGVESAGVKTIWKREDSLSL